MHAIGSPIDDQRRSLHLTDNASEVGKQIRTERWLDESTPALCAEDEMQQNVAGGMRQGLSSRWGFSLPFKPNPRLTPWAAFLRRFAAFL
jgi:hypothetical protein